MAIARWEFKDGSGTLATDTYGTNHGTLYSMEDDSWQEGILEFDGTDDFIQVSNDKYLQFGYTDSFSIMAWIKTDSDGTIIRSEGSP